MTTMRMLGTLAAASVLAMLAGLGTGWQATAAAAGAAAPVADAACSDARGFRELLETVRAKAAELERREAALAARESGLVAARRIVASEVARLEAVAKALGLADSPGEGMSIAKAYESMDAADAAPILDRLDDRTLRAVLGRMRERQVGAILAAMSRERAVAVTRVLAGAPAPASAAPR